MMPPENRFPKSRNARVTGFMSSSRSTDRCQPPRRAKNDFM